ncbi:MAG TPA: sigma-70 family RNA polymerase sigma factor [Candidatus Dwaynia gallinarum]|nr:sigma-70 family RNA polymerase sigma factor [Candidatus Dwaynia gallinarum]
MDKKYHIYVKGKEVSVDKNIYLTYKKQINHENYLRHNRVKYKVFTFSDFEENVIANISDKNMDVYYEVESKLEIQNLYKALSKLNNKEKEIIYLIYFENKTLREIGKMKNISYTQIANIRNKILKKLRLLLES